MKKIEILGGGCANCNQLIRNTEEAARNLGIEITIEKVQDYLKIASYGVMTTPALVVDGDLKFYGKVMSAKNIEQFLD